MIWLVAFVIISVPNFGLAAPRESDSETSRLSVETQLICPNRSLYEDEISQLRQNVQRLNNVLSAIYATPSTPSKQCALTQFVFPRHNQQQDYIRYKRFFPTLKSGTMCFWYTVEDLSSLVALVSYQTSTNVNHILIELRPPSILRLIVDGSRADFDFDLQTTVNHHICAWFNSEDRILGFYVNGEEFGPKGYAGGFVSGGGSFLIGQDEDRNVAGGIGKNQSLKGTIENLVIYPRVLTQVEIQRMRVLCQCPIDHMVSMTLDRVEFLGQTTYTIPGKCPGTM